MVDQSDLLSIPCTTRNGLLDCSMLVIMKRIRFLATNEEAQTLTYFPRTTRLMAVVGTPLAHSLSPQIHNKTIDRLGLPYCYVPIEINLTNDDAVMAFLQWSWQIGIEGMNVTLPYKERFAKVLNARLPSINTLTRGESFGSAIQPTGLVFCELQRNYQVKRSPITKNY